MNKRVFIFVWCVCFVFLLGSFVFPIGFTPVANPSVLILLNDDSVEVIENHRYVRQALTMDQIQAADASVKYLPERIPGPVQGLVELWITESAFASKTCIQQRKQKLTNEQIDRAYEAILTYAKSDPSFTKYRPGQPPQTRFSFLLAGQTILRLTALFGIPTVVAYVAKLVVDKQVSVVRSRRRDSGLCIQCEYPCATLPTLKCPECGCFHTVPYQPSPDSDDQPPA